MRMNETSAKKNVSEQKAMIGTHNDGLKCKDCAHKYDDSIIFGNVSRCEVYPQHKPQDVLDGGDCNEYEKDEE